MDGPTCFPSQWEEEDLPLSLAGIGALVRPPPAATAPRRCPNGGESPHRCKESREHTKGLRCPEEDKEDFGR